MRHWSEEEAQAKFDEMLDACTAEGAQMIRKRGTDAVVFMTVEEWERLNAGSRPASTDLLLQDSQPGT